MGKKGLSVITSAVSFALLSQERSAELMAPLFEQIQTTVNEVAAQQGLDLILNLTMGSYGVLDRNILYVSPELQTEYNITLDVIENLDL